MYNYKRREVDIIMKNNNYRLDHYTGSHAIYKNDKGEHISIGTCKCNGLIMYNLSKKHNLDLSVKRKKRMVI